MSIGSEEIETSKMVSYLYRSGGEGLVGMGWLEKEKCQLVTKSQLTEPELEQNKQTFHQKNDKIKLNFNKDKLFL